MMTEQGEQSLPGAPGMTAQPSLTAESGCLPAQAAQTVWVTDAELIRRSGVPSRIMRSNIRALDANKFSGFPKKDPMWGGRRHWPSVQKYWENRANQAVQAAQRSTMPQRQTAGGRA